MLAFDSLPSLIMHSSDTSVVFSNFFVEYMKRSGGSQAHPLTTALNL